MAEPAVVAITFWPSLNRVVCAIMHLAVCSNNTVRAEHIALAEAVSLRSDGVEKIVIGTSAYSRRTRRRRMHATISDVLMAVSSLGHNLGREIREI